MIGTPMLHEPTETGTLPSVVRQWELDADGTRYRVIVVGLAGDMGSTMDMFPPDIYVMAEPANMKRVWFPLNDPDQVSEAYIMEKTGCRGADARNLTRLLAEALGVSPIYLSEEGA